MRLLPDLLRLVARLARDDDVPGRVRLLLWLLLAYVASPIDLVPDFIPVIGYLDDLIVVPLGIALALKLVPAQVMADCRAQALAAETMPLSRAAAAVIITLWLAAAVLVFVLVRNLFAS